MKVSILIPTYNRAILMPDSKGQTLVERAIDSVLEQGYPDMEILILNDGSTDATSQIIKRYENWGNGKGKLPKVKIWDENFNRLPPNNMNFLWQQATGELICQMHDDDIMPVDSISSRVEVFKNNPELQVIYGGWQTQDLNGNITGTYKATPPDPIRIMQSEYINFTTLMYKRNLLFRFDAELRYYFDWLFKIRCLHECKAGYIENSVMIHTVHEGQETTKCRRENANASQEKLMREKLARFFE